MTNTQLEIEKETDTKSILKLNVLYISRDFILQKVICATTDFLQGTTEEEE